MIKAICFDLDGVYFTPRGKNSFHQALVTEFGGNKEAVDELMYRSPEMAKLVRSQISPSAFWDRARAMTGITASDKELADRWIRDYEINPDVRAAVLKARQKSFKTCVCTNNNAIRLPPLVERYKLNDDFDVIVSSHEIGQTKPYKEIYQALLQFLEVKPDELVYSDDNPDRLTGAQALGINTFVYESFEQFLSELQKLGVDLR
ncbi:MAG: HAD family hydrolase [Bdellovibrionales bacterium]